MIDTVRLTISPKDPYALYDILGEPEQRLQRGNLIIPSWRLRNMRISILGSDIKIRGSISKFIAGTNLTTLSAKQISQAFGEMSEALHLPVKKAMVTRFDAGINVITNELPGAYFDTLGRLPRYERCTFGMNTLSYHLQRRSVQFYNKKAEMKKKKFSIPKEYIDKNIMRYEVQWKKAVSRQWKRDIYAYTLTKPAYLRLVAKRMQTIYNKIPKMQGLRIRKATKFKEVKKLLVSIGIEKLGGINEVLNYFESEKDAGNITSNDYGRIRDGLLKIETDPKMISPNALAAELGRKIENALNKFIDTQ